MLFLLGLYVSAILSYITAYVEVISIKDIFPALSALNMMKFICISHTHKCTVSIENDMHRINSPFTELLKIFHVIHDIGINTAGSVI